MNKKIACDISSTRIMKIMEEKQKKITENHLQQKNGISTEYATYETSGVYPNLSSLAGVFNFSSMNGCANSSNSFHMCLAVK